MASANTKKPCATCNKSAGVATCDGCQQSFCSKHFVDHRQALAQQMEDIGQQHDLLRRDLDQNNAEHSLLSRINTWEQESISKIQVTAEAARADLHELLDRNRKELKKLVAKITNELQTYRESDDFTEIDIKKWTEQLQGLRKILESPSTISIEENEIPKSTIRLIKVRDQQQHRLGNFAAESLEHRIPVVEKSSSSSNERFEEVSGKGLISEVGLVIRCQTKYSFAYLTCYGANRYSSGTHHIHFRIEKIGSMKIFFGITTSNGKVTNADNRAQSFCGWWDMTERVMNNIIQESSDNNVVRTGDEMILILDCDNRQIQLGHHRTNLLHQGSIDINNCPFPWKIAVKLQSYGDSVRILQ